MKIKDVMTKSVETVRPDQTLQEAASRMKSLDVGPMPVCENDRLVGMITDRDIVVRAAAEGRDVRTTKVREAMTPDVAVCSEDDDVKAAGKDPAPGSRQDETEQARCSYHRRMARN